MLLLFCCCLSLILLGKLGNKKLIYPQKSLLIIKKKFNSLSYKWTATLLSIILPIWVQWIFFSLRSWNVEVVCFSVLLACQFYKQMDDSNDSHFFFFSLFKTQAKQNQFLNSGSWNTTVSFSNASNQKVLPASKTNLSGK